MSSARDEIRSTIENPPDDAIHAVVTDGRLIGRSARGRLLAGIEAEAARTPPPITRMAPSCRAAPARRR